MGLLYISPWEARQRLFSHTPIPDAWDQMLCANIVKESLATTLFASKQLRPQMPSIGCSRVHLNKEQYMNIDKVLGPEISNCWCCY